MYRRERQCSPSDSCGFMLIETFSWSRGGQIITIALSPLGILCQISLHVIGVVCLIVHMTVATERTVARSVKPAFVWVCKK